LSIGGLEHAATRSPIFAQHIPRKICRIAFSLKANQIVFQQQRQQSFMVRKDRCHLRRWKRHVQEEPNAILVTALPQFMSKWDEVIVVNPDEIIGLNEPRQLAGKMRIDPEVSGEIAAREFREVESVVENGPQDSIGKPVVELLMTLFGEIG
jgi:hypothetical protein